MIFLEYNVKTRMGILMCMLLMLSVLLFVLAGVFRAARPEPSRPVGATPPDEDAIEVGAKPIETTTATPETGETTTNASETEKKALYYVTLSGDQVVLLDAYGEYLTTLNEYADFLPKEDLDTLRAGVALYSKEEMEQFAEDFS